MTLRFTPTIAICSVAAGLTAVALAVPDPNPAEDPSASVYSSVGADQATETTLNSSAADTTAAATAAAPVIEIVDFTFGGQLVVQSGQVIDVANIDSAPHTVTADDGSFDTGTLDAGGSGQIVAPSVAGTYSFICTIHPSMTAELTVTN